jgi:hypothetical protein
MNDMVPADRRDLLPDLCRGGSQELAEAVHRVLHPHPDLALNAPVVDEATRLEAEQRLRLLDAAMKPATPQQWAEFLRPLIPVVGNPPTRDAFKAYIASVVFGFGDIPSGVLTEDRSRQAVRRYKFWPTGEDLDKWLSPFVHALRDERRALERLRRGAAPTPVARPAEPPILTDDERAAAVSLLRAVPRNESTDVRASYVDDAALLGAYERIAAENPGLNGNAARTRVAALRKKLRIEAA